MISPQLTSSLAALADNPRAVDLRQNALGMLRQASLEELREVAHTFAQDLPVIEAVEAIAREQRLVDETIWTQIASTLSLFAGLGESRQVALEAIDNLFTINPNSAAAYDAALFLKGPYSGASREEVLDLSKRYLEVAPHDIRAISYRTKALLRFDGVETARLFLSRMLSNPELAAERPALRDEVQSLLSTMQ